MQSKAALYRLGASLIKNRIPVIIITTILTGFMAYKMSTLEMSTAFNDLLPYRHPFVQVHFKFASQFGGANNINLMLKVEKDDRLHLGTMKKIYRDDTGRSTVSWHQPRPDRLDRPPYDTLLRWSGGTIATPPVMRRAPKTDAEVEEIRKGRPQHGVIHGKLVSLKARRPAAGQLHSKGGSTTSQHLRRVNRRRSKPVRGPRTQ